MGCAGFQDDSHVAMCEHYEVHCWIRKFGISRAELQKVVDALGNGADAVERRVKS